MEVAFSPLLIIGGRGAMGRFFTKYFQKLGVVVEVADKESDLKSISIDKFSAIMLAVPLSSFREVIVEIKDRINPKALVFDIASLKAKVCQEMESAFSQGEILGLHPMFGGDVPDVTGQKIVTCKIRAKERAGFLLKKLEESGAKLIERTPEEHDRQVKFIQALSHCVKVSLALAIADSGDKIENLIEIASPVAEIELALLGRLFSHGSDLYYEIQLHTDEVEVLHQNFLTKFKEVSKTIAAADREKFSILFEKIKRYFGESASILETKSQKICYGGLD